MSTVIRVLHSVINTIFFYKGYSEPQKKQNSSTKAEHLREKKPVVIIAIRLRERLPNFWSIYTDNFDLREKNAQKGLK